MKKKTNTVLHIRTRNNKITCFLVLSFSFLLSYAQSYEECFEQGLTAARAQQHEQAISHFQQALKLSPDNIRNALIHANIAHVLLAKGEQMKALESYDLALGIAPLNIPILQARANLYLTLGNHGKALLDYTKIIDLDPKNNDALLQRAYIYQQRRDYHSAQADS